MGFRVRIVEGPARWSATGSSAKKATPAQIAAEADIVDRYLRALQTAEPAPTSAEYERLEQQFISVASTFSTRLHISYAAWCDVDVSSATLDEAGIRDEGTALVSPAYAQHRLGAVPAPTHPRHATRHTRYRDSRQTSWRSSRRQLPRS